MSDSTPSTPNDKNKRPNTKSISTCEIFEPTQSSLRKMWGHLLYETADHYIGPMPIRNFFDTFMPWNEETPTSYRNSNPPRKRLCKIIDLPNCSERESYQQFVDAFNGWAVLSAWQGKDMPKDIAAPLIFRDSHKYHDRDCQSLSVDISVYSGAQFVPRSSPPNMDFANLHCWIELKPSIEYDAFDDGDYVEEVNKTIPDAEEVDENYNLPDTYIAPNRTYPFENYTIQGCYTRARLASYAGATMATQYRNHLFTALVAGNKARFMNWDRSSVVVSSSFDITEEPHLLFDFFKRLRQLTRTQRGSNPNVQPAMKEEAKLARDLLKKLAPELWLGFAGQIFLKNIDIATQPFFKLTFEQHIFLVPAPHCNERSLSPFGRSSRGCAAVQLTGEEKRVCYIKDSWHDPDRTSEPEIYVKLKKAGVTNVAEMICGGDWGVSSMGTHTSDNWVWKGDLKLRTRKLQWTFIALDAVGRSLYTFRKAHNVVGGLADAMQAYEDALSKAGIMHRDISVSNILLVPQSDKSWKGILIDWDHALDNSDNSGRTGTWRFMSIALVSNARANHNVIDDRESLFYVLLWIALCFLRHNLDESKLNSYIKAFDYCQEVEHGVFEGGELKRSILDRLSRNPIEFDLNPITDLVRDLTHTFYLRYNTLESFDFKYEDCADIKQKYTNELMTTLHDRDWLINKLRKVEEQLKENQEIAELRTPDWVDNLKDILGEVQEGCNPVCIASHLFDEYTLCTSGNGSAKRSAVGTPVIKLEDLEEGEEASEGRAAKRARLEDYGK